APVAPIADPDGPLCVVLRTQAPRSVLWAQHGCPPDPAPLAAERRPCRVQWGSDVMKVGYDTAGRLAEVQHLAVATSYRYDGAGQLTEIGWGNADRETAIEVAREGGVVTYRTDISEHRATVDGGRMTRFEIDESHVCTLSRDARGVVQAVASTMFGQPDGGARFTRDAAGLIVRRDDGGRPWTYRWDRDGRLLAIDGWEAPVTVEYRCE
ncbi:MAG: hypothetical protein KIT12_13210, partial [Trueperaceae bacterium]|nr:hypothetical protein [Trueperaceae bacterium]